MKITHINKALGEEHMLERHTKCIDKI